MDPRWKHPFPALIAGPTCCGKSQFVKRLLESGEDIIDGAPENIIWFSRSIFVKQWHRQLT